MIMRAELERSMLYVLPLLITAAEPGVPVCFQYRLGQSVI
jgi:hypothetical protein